jgi:phage repressor protein C with HTH and peptisase S24 domain
MGKSYALRIGLVNSFRIVLGCDLHTMSDERTGAASRLKEARKMAGYDNPSDAARALGAELPTYLGHENGSRGLSRAAFRYADFYNVRLDWLLTGRGAMREGSAGQVAEPLRMAPFGEAQLAPRDMARDIPVYGSASCGEDGLFEFNGEVADFVRRPPRLIAAKDAYALYVANESMVPWREPGQLVYVHPAIAARVGDYVVVQLHPKREGQSAIPEAYIKRLLRLNSESVVLLQYNPRKEITIRRKQIKSLHRIVDWSELMGI